MRTIFGVGARLVDEHQLGGVKARLACLPTFASQGYVGPGLFGGVQRFFGGDRVPLEEGPNRGPPKASAQDLPRPSDGSLPRSGPVPRGSNASPRRMGA